LNSLEIIDQKNNYLLFDEMKDKYKSELIHVPSSKNPDVLIPVTLFYKSNLTLDSNNPLLIEGYGAYGSSLEFRFETQKLLLLNRDYILAFAHVLKSFNI
jgi:oligopeptidase B